MAPLQCIGQFTVEIGHADVQQRIFPAGVQRILRYFLNRSPMTDSTADSAVLVEIGSPDRYRLRNAAHNFSFLRRLALNLFRADTSRKMSLRRKRTTVAWNPDYLAHVLGLPGI